MIQYDSAIINTMADALYAQARRIELIHAVAGALLGAGAGSMLAEGIEKDLFIVGMLGGLVVGAWTGFTLGRSKAFLLRLQAQMGLCQVQIERNTRDALRVTALQANAPAERSASTAHPLSTVPNSSDSPTGSLEGSRIDAISARVPPRRPATGD